MDLSIIIVNWNSKDYLKRCIRSVLDSTQGIEYEIVVIDSGSFDGCGEMLKQEYPQVRFVQSEKNIGFAGANNAAFKVSNGRNLLFLNPDTEIEGLAIGALYCELTTLQNVGVVGAKLLNTDGSIQTSCIQAFPTVLNQLLDFDVLRTAFPRSGIWGTRSLFEGGSAAREVDAVSGACLMIKRSLFESVGMFTADYFMYSEDIDLCFKVRQAGRMNYYVPSAVVVHHGGTSSSKSSIGGFPDVMMLESRWRFFRRTRPYWYCWVYRVAMSFVSVIRIGTGLVVWPIYQLWGRGASIMNVMKKWTARLRWALGGERWVRKY